jgi:Glycosyl transferases group 1
MPDRSASPDGCVCAVLPPRATSSLNRPLRILHVSSFTFTRLRGACFHSVGYKLSNGLTRLGHSVLNFGDRELARALNPFGSRKFGRGAVNKLLLQTCEIVRPDLLLLGHADMITAATLCAARQRDPAMRLAQWNVDALFDEDNVGRIRSKLPSVDVTFVSTGGERLQALASAGHTIAFLPNPVDSSIESGRNFAANDLSTDLFCAVGHPDQPRFHAGVQRSPRALRALLESRIPAIRCHIPGVPPDRHLVGHLYQSALESARCGLNFSRRSDVYLYSSDRLAHLIGNGLLTFIDRATGYPEIFSDEEMAFYSTEDELIEKLIYFLANDQALRRVAKAGWTRYHALFNCERVADYMIGVLYEKYDPLTFRWH